MHLPLKTAQLRAGKDIKDTQIPTISEHLLKISQKFSGDIREHPVLMKMDDCLFERTSRYYNTLLIIQMFGFFLPLVLQILFEGDADLVLRCNYCCLAVTIFLHLQEIIFMMSLSFSDYWFGDWYHIIDNVLFVLYYYYFSIRVKNPGEYLLPLARLESFEDKCTGTTKNPLCREATLIEA